MEESGGDDMRQQTYKRHGRKITASVTLELEQLERLHAVSDRTRINRSVLIREGIDEVLRRYEADAPPQKVETFPGRAQGRAAPTQAAARRP